MFGVSALYHRVDWKSTHVRTWMRRLDHSTILLLIAGTYTPFALLVLDGGRIGSTNVAGFTSTPYDRAMRGAARILDTRMRNRAYGALDARLARDAAPLAAMGVLNEATFVSERVGCKVLRPALDLTAVCLK